MVGKNNGMKMAGLKGTKSDDFINAAKSAASRQKDKQPRLTKLERAFRHAAIRRKSQEERRATSSMSTTAE